MEATGKNLPFIMAGDETYWLTMVECGLRVADAFECQSEEELLNYWFPKAIWEAAHAPVH